MKDPLCDGCPLLRSPGPVMGEFTGDQVDVVFLGEALGAVEVMQRRPMVGMAGQTLRRTLKALDLSSYGITNVWKCRPPGNQVPEGEPAEFCRRSLLEDLTTHDQKLTVPLGGTALNSLTATKSWSITSVKRRMFSVKLDGRTLPLVAMTHPSYVNRRGESEWRDWELGFDKIVRYLGGHIDYVPPGERTVYKSTTVSVTRTLLHKLRQLSVENPVLACDIETSAGYSPWAGARILSVSIAWSPYESVAMTWDSIVGNTNFEILKGLLESPEITWLWYNGQFDTQFFRYEGIEPRIGRDAMLEASTVDERANVHNLKYDAGVFLDVPDWEHDIKDYVPGKEDSYENIPTPKLLDYNGYDTLYTYHLSSVLRRIAVEERVLDYHERVVVPTYDLLAEARFEGVRVDMYRVKELQELIQPVLDDLRQRLTELTGDPFFNPNSWQDKLKYLHERGLMVPNTRKETLEEYAGDEFVDLVREFMDANKMLSTYIVGVADDVYDDLRVHPDWKTPTETGRPRCQDPNMLGMPRKAEEDEHRWKRYIKEIFIADPGTLLMHIDRRQSEVRCEVFLADDTEFVDLLKADPNADIHGEYTALMYGPNYTPEQRVLIKMMVFGLIYGREAPSLARQFTAIERTRARKEGRTEYHVWTVREAQQFIDQFFARIPKVKKHRRDVIREALSTWRLTSYLGRVRRFGLVNQNNRKSVENQAVNFPPSSLSADLNFLSCIETRKRYGKYGVKVLVPVHDSALIKIPKNSDGLPDEIKGMWERLALDVLSTSLPFPCDVSVGERWSDLS